MRSPRLAICALGLAVLTTSCCLPTFLAPPGGTPVPTPRGRQYDVKISDLPTQVVDASRGRTIPLRVFYPGGFSGKAPVVLVSHGGNKSDLNAYAYLVALQYLGRALATAGYVAVLPSHTGPAPRYDRPRDDSFLMDRIDAGSLSIPGFTGTLDKDRIGVAGHSWGSYTALSIGGATSTAGSFDDPRAKAIVGLSPQGAGQFGFTEGSWSHMTRPTYTIFGSAEADGSNDDGFIAPMWRRQPYDGMPAGNKFVSIVPDAVHSDFSQGDSPVALATQAFVSANVVAFFDRYLKGDMSISCQIGCVAAPGGTSTLRK